MPLPSSPHMLLFPLVSHFEKNGQSRVLGYLLFFPFTIAIRDWRSWRRLEVLSNVVDGPARSGGLLPPLFLIPALLNPIDKLHLGLDERQQVRCVQLAPTLFGHHQQLVRHDQPLRP